MRPRSFSELYEEAERHEDYRIAGAILEFTESVAREMNRQGLTRTELAERLGATPAYITKILRGRVNFTLATMVRLAGALGNELEVRIGGGSRRRVVERAGEASSASIRSRLPRKVAATAGRPAALRSKPSDRKSAKVPTPKVHPE